MSPGTLLRNFRPAGQVSQDNGGTPERHARFGLLLLVLMTTYILSAFIRDTWVGALQIALFVWVTALALRSGDVKRAIARLVTIAAIGGSAIAVTLALTHSSDAVGGVAYLWAALLLLLAVVLILGRVLRMPEVTLQSIFGAVSAYMILGFMFAAIYSAIYHFDGSFFAQGAAHDDLKTFQYFSFTTLTTLGYGDYTAARSGGQAVAAMEALLGQVFLATLVARLVATFRVHHRREAASPGRTAETGHPASPGTTASSGNPASPGNTAGSGNTASPDAPPPAGPSAQVTRVSPRARARLARRSRLRSGQR
jgi:ABC-type multidrug transport system fused ATPase/permease subunit